MAQKSKGKKQEPRSLEEVMESLVVYPLEAYEFVQSGLTWTVTRVHEKTPEGESLHVTGRQLSEGLREYAWSRWGLMARAVLERWNITSTLDFGRIVYALIEAGVLSKTESDRLEDFKSVYDFRTLETQYRCEVREEAAAKPAKQEGKA